MKNPQMKRCVWLILMFFSFGAQIIFHSTCTNYALNNLFHNTSIATLFATAITMVDILFLLRLLENSEYNATELNLFVLWFFIISGNSVLIVLGTDFPFYFTLAVGVAWFIRLTVIAIFFIAGGNIFNPGYPLKIVEEGK